MMRAGARRVHLFFVKLFGAKLLAESVAVDLAGFSGALPAESEQPQISRFVADARVPSGSMRPFDSEVPVLRNQMGEAQSALWAHLAHPIAIKVNYLVAGAPLQAPPGNPRHPPAEKDRRAEPVCRRGEAERGAAGTQNLTAAASRGDRAGTDSSSGPRNSLAFVD
jgi:hypothetical protein